MEYFLTEQEKNDLREKYIANVNKLNQVLPNNLKINPNLNAFNRRLNDSNEQGRYKKAIELHQNALKREEIANELKNKYSYLQAKNPNHSYLMTRTISYLIDLRPGAEKYNEALVKTYYLHPEAVAQYAYKKAMEINPGDLLRISKCADADNLLLEYYEKNRIACDLGFCIRDSYDLNTKLTDDAKEYLDIISSDYQIVSKIGTSVKAIADNYFTMPNLSDEQIEKIADSKIISDVPLYRSVMNVATDFPAIKKAKDEYKILSDKGLEKNYNKPGAFCYYICQDKKTKEYKSYYDVVIENKENEYDIIKFDDEKAQNILKIHENDYILEENVKFPKPLPQDEVEELLGEFRYRYAINNNTYLSKLEEKSLAQLHSSVKKGFFEFIRRSTSQYTKDLQTVIKNFETPGNKDYKNKEKLKEAAEAYLKHRNVRTRADALRQNSSAKNRSLICLDIIASINAMNEKINIKEKDLEIDPEEILNEKNNEKNKENVKPVIREEFTTRIKETIDEDADIGEIKYDEDIEINPDFVIRDESKIVK